MSSPLALYGPSRFKSSVFFLSLLITATQLGHSQTTSTGAKIDNFGQINENYYRGAQPSASGFVALKGMGVKTVIDLQKDGIVQEAAWVEDAGMKYIKIPLSSTHPATAEQTEYFLKLVNDPSNWPVYVHCAGGRHRTGEMTAIYRITHDSWSADQAFNEMNRYGYYSFPNHGSLKKYVYTYYRNYQIERGTKKVLISAPGPQQTESPVSTHMN